MASRMHILATCLLLFGLVAGAGCPDMTGTELDGGGGAANGGGDGSGGTGAATTASGTWNPTDGLNLSAGSVTLAVGADDQPSVNELTMEILDEDDLVAAGLYADSGFDVGITFGPDGATFARPVEVTVQLAEASPLNNLLVLKRDETTGAWGASGTLAVVSQDGLSATFELTSFSTYVPWAPPPPSGSEPIGGAGIVAGSGSFSGTPFDPLPGITTASLTYSPYGDVFGLSLINAGLQTGPSLTASAGLHATRVEEYGNGAIGYVTPGGGLSGPSIYNDGNTNYHVSGVMFLSVDATGNWTVAVYCAYESGVIVGAAVGD